MNTPTPRERLWIERGEWLGRRLRETIAATARLLHRREAQGKRRFRARTAR